MTPDQLSALQTELQQPDQALHLRRVSAPQRRNDRASQPPDGDSMTNDKTPVIPAHATVFDAPGGTVSIYRDSNNIVLVGIFGASSSVWTMNREGALSIASAILNHATGQGGS